MIKVLLVDDHLIVRDGLKRIINDCIDIIVEDEASNGIEALELLSKNKYDLVLMDITMPEKNGLDTLKEMKTKNLRTPVLILTVHSEEQYALRIMKSGASGFIKKDARSKELIDAIRKIANGGVYISEAVAEKLAAYVNDNINSLSHEVLSDREYQVMMMIAKGKTPGEMAEELNISKKTVATYRLRLLQKMNLGGNVDLTHYAMKNHLIEY